ncbi:MAG: DeoR/GlpR family DNA-binding transcription regulator [Spirochaetaceae bacterium]|jgi:DeoR/GlpR family transcriptional regulator of sugar metabolism|nr:DeoR/GlpR family DNA-binding transcription regulator [Spirochaetaceae bacterium]
MLNIERKNMILDLLKTKQAVTVAELSAVLDVSIVTVRKILTALDRQGLLHRTRGGAVSVAMPFRESTVADKLNEAKREKQAIAARAYSLIENQETIYLDAGTTTLELTRLIKKGPKRDLTLVTNAINLVAELLDMPDIRVILTGGELRHSVISCVGPLAEISIRGLHFDKAFIAANNVNLDFGPSTPVPAEAQVKRTAIESASAAYLLCDSRKFGSASLISIAPLSAFAAIITDNGLDETYCTEFTRAGLQLFLAEVS